MDYSTKSYNDRLKEKKDFEMHGCIQFILFFIFMAIVIAIIAWSQSGIDY